MTRDPIRRRYGFGAARLAVGLPPQSERLSERARTKIALERRLTVVPVATLVAIAWLLSSASTPPRLEALETRILVDAWTNPTAAVVPVAVAVADLPQPEPEARAANPDDERLAPPEVRHDARTRTDAIRLAQNADPRTSSTGRSQSSQNAMGSSPARDTNADSRSTPARREFDVQKLATRGASWTPGTERFDGSSAAPDPTHDTRPPIGERRRGSSEKSALAERLTEATSTGARSRRDALDALERDADAARGRASGGPLASAGGLRPAVSAARAGPALLDTGSSGGELGGWQEVPLEALPDCDPPGRQDLLKKRILLAVPGRRECVHASGNFRFVETRNLGAFLMWSRPNPAALAGQPRDRDACDVLERALACLGVP